ncbi:MAG: TolC family protein [Bacteroidales bacterium]|nr:TolC family protein [Bacteroidales bacterium]MDD2425662.1 TolC family protein [Bacteroidales bacterium]MDD3989570.1 TolC family protein [Bacteroidales bacterium]
MKRVFVILLIILLPVSFFGQKKGISLERAIELALENNQEFKAARLKLQQSKAMRPAAFNPAKTNFFLAYDSNNMADNDHPLNIIGIEQSFSFPTVYISQFKVADSEISLAEKEMEIQKQKLIRDVSMAYHEIQYHMNRLMHINHLDSIYAKFTANLQEKYNNGEIARLDLINSKAKHQHVQIEQNDITYDTRLAYKRLRLLLNTDTLIVVPLTPLAELPVTDPEIENTPGIKYMVEETQLQKNLLKTERSNLLPEISLSYQGGTNRFPNAKFYPGYEVGISLPLFFGEQKAKIKAQKIGIAVSQELQENYRNLMSLKILELYSDINKFREHLDYYYSTGKDLSREIEESAQKAYANGEIDYINFVESIENSTHIKIDYLHWLHQYNNKVLELKHLVLE